jgi:putative PEP-CTERM system TPR-repeat lipoprotein
MFRASCFVVALVVSGGLLSGCSGDPNQRKREHLESGDQYAAQKNWAAAIIEYRNAVQIDPTYGEARYKLFEALIESGDARAAAGELIRAADLLSSRMDVQLRAGSVLLLSGRFDDALVRAGKVLAVEPKNVSAQILKANALAGLKDFQSALAEIESAIELEPDRSASYTALGAVRVSRGEGGEAERAFKRAIELDAKSVSARLALAGFYWAGNRLPEAEAEFQQARKLEPENLLANRALATFYLSSNRSAQAESYLQVLAKNDSSFANRLALADYYVMMGRFDDALRSLEPITDESPKSIESSLRVAIINYLQKKPAEAHRVVDAVLVRAPTRTDALLTKARFLVTEKKFAEALTLAQRASEIDPGSIRAHYTVGAVQSSLKQYPEAKKAFARVLDLNPRAVAAQVRMAELELMAGNAAASLQHAQDAVIAQPQNAIAHLLLAKSHLAENNLPAAHRELSSLAKAHPKWALVQTQLGLVALRQRNLTQARAAFETALSLDPRSSEALAGLVALDVAGGKPDQATRRIEARVAAAPEDASSLLMSARAYMLVKDYARSEQLLKKVMQLNPNEMRAYTDLASVYVRTGRLDEARRNLETIPAKEPIAFAQAQTMAGVILQTQRREDDAIKTYERALEAEKDSAVAANNLAWMYAERGRNLDAALQLAMTAKRLLPHQPAVGDTLGYVYLKRSSPDLAVPVLREAVQQEPENTRYRLRLGIALAQAGHAPEARRELETALKADPKLPEAVEARAALASLPSAER